MSDAEPLISFITPAWNAASTLSDTIQSVSKQTISGWELVLVDDGSTDETAEIARRWAAADCRIRVVTQPNRGFMAARNTGLEHCHSRLVSFLDADDLIETTYVEESVAALNRNREADITVCAWSYLFSDGSVSDPTVFAEGLVSDPLAKFLAMPIIFGSSVLRKEVAQRFEFDAAAKSSGDFMYWFRLAKSGARIVGIPRCLFYYRQVPSSLSRRDPLLCLEQDFDVWNEVERWVSRSAIAPVLRRKQIALISYVCRMIAIGEAPWNERARVHFPLLVDLPGEALAVSISEMLPIYLGRHPRSWPQVLEEYRQSIRQFLQELQEELALPKIFAEGVFLRLEAPTMDAFMAALDSSSHAAILVEALRSFAGEKLTGLASNPATGGTEAGRGRSPKIDELWAPLDHESTLATHSDIDVEASGRAPAALLSHTRSRLRLQGETTLPLEIDMRAGRPDTLLYGAGGWSFPEDWGTWTDGPEARLLVALRGEVPRELSVEVELEHVFCPDPQAPLHVVVEVNREAVQELVVKSAGEHSTKVIHACVPSALVESLGGMLIVLRFQGNASPQSLGISGDTRHLGLGVNRIRIS